MSDNSTRRKFIAATGSAAALALAGCSGDSGGNGTANGTAENATGTEAMTEQMTESSPMGPDMEPRTVTVRIENVSPSDVYRSDSHTGGAVWITPGAYAVHSGSNPIYTEGESASIGLEALAEAGPPTGFDGEPGLVDELSDMSGGMGDDSMGDDSMGTETMGTETMGTETMGTETMGEDGMGGDGSMSSTVAHSGAFTPQDTVADPNDPTGNVPGAAPIAPGGAFEFDVQALPGQRFSFASMFVPSNDIFFSPGSNGIELWPEDGEPNSGDVTEHVHLWDAGTEPNQAPGQGADQAPAQNSPTQGGSEGGVVQRLSDVNDGYRYPDVSNVIRVTLTPHDSMGDGGMNDGDGMGTETMGDGMGTDTMG